MRIFAAFVILALPQLAIAEGSGSEAWSFTVEEEFKTNSDASFESFWDLIDNWMIWGGLIWLAVSVMFLKGVAWWLGVIVWFVGAWGDDLAHWVGGMGGVS